jgi:hypothetical protein
MRNRTPCLSTAITSEWEALGMTIRCSRVRARSGRRGDKVDEHLTYDLQ